MKRKLRSLLLALVAVIALAGFALLLFTQGKPAPPPPLPNPNGHDDFTKAGQMRTGQLDDFRTASVEELRAYVTTNAAALAQMRLGLSRECRVPLDFALTNSLGNLAELRSLAQLLAAEGRLAELENRPADAARSYVDTIRFGNASSRGGPMINHLVGAGCEAIGYNPLVKLVPRLNCEQLQPVMGELVKVDNTGVTWDEVCQNEKLFVRHQLHQTFNPIRHIAGWWQTRRAIQKAEERHDKGVARLHLLTTELALRCYQAEQSRAPERLDQLVPKYLQSVPTDPFSEHPLVYLVQGTNWVLYSVGLDRMDDGGKPVGRTVSGKPATGDLFFDSPW